MVIERKSRVGIGGVLVALVAVMLALGAINSGNNLLYLVFGVVIGSIIVSGLVSGSMLMGLRVSRHLPTRLRVGETDTIAYDLRNSARFSHAFGLVVREASPDAARLLSSPSVYESHIPPRSVRTVAMDVTPQRRGVATLDRVEVSSRFPVGFLEKTISARQRAAVIIHPRIVELKPETTRAIAGRASVSSHHQRRAGMGDEFFGLREYTQGDPVRQIAWRASARADTLVVRQNNQRRTRTIWILLDDTAPDEDAITLAASIADDCIGRDMSVGLATATRGSIISLRRGTRQRTLVLDALATLEHNPDARAIPWRAAGRAACAVVLSARGTLTETPPDAIHFEPGALARVQRTAPGAGA